MNSWAPAVIQNNFDVTETQKCTIQCFLDGHLKHLKFPIPTQPLTQQCFVEDSAYSLTTQSIIRQRRHSYRLNSSYWRILKSWVSWFKKYTSFPYQDWWRTWPECPVLCQHQQWMNLFNECHSYEGKALLQGSFHVIQARGIAEDLLRTQLRPTRSLCDSESAVSRIGRLLPITMHSNQ